MRAPRLKKITFLRFRLSSNIFFQFQRVHFKFEFNDYRMEFEVKTKYEKSWVQLEFHLLHSHQDIVKILIMIFLGLLLCYSTTIGKNTIRNIARLAMADVATSTCQKVFGRLSPSFIGDLKYVGETRYRICCHKIICTIRLWQNIVKTGNSPFRR